MTDLHPGTAITAESVTSLQAGDLLKVVNADAFLSARGFGNGSQVTFRSLSNGFIDLADMPYPQGTRPFRFEFVARPSGTFSSPEPVKADQPVDWSVVGPELVEAATNALNFLRNAPLESGVCCCGDPVAGHNMGSGHAPVDDLAFHSDQIAIALGKALSRTGAGQ